MKEDVPGKTSDVFLLYRNIIINFTDKLINTQRTDLSLYTRGSQTVGRAPGGRCLSSAGARVVCMRNTFILNEIWAQGKIYILLGTLLG
jgi:hypothetical protein